MAKLPEEKWLELCERLNLKSRAQSQFAELAARYNEPQRAYHNLIHVMDCLEQFDPVHDLAQDPVAVELAIWYHDAVYDSRAKDNEEQSAALAANAFAVLGLPELLREKTNRLIFATKKHDISLDGDAGVIVDVDLSILGRLPDRFDEYERQIRKEYDWVPAGQFAAGRKAVLESFLSRSTVFSTKYFRGRYETQARENMKRSIHALQN